MNAVQIRTVLDAIIAQKLCTFLGVFPRNLVPSTPAITKLPACYVANSDDEHQPGQHWLAIFIDNEKNLEFFDSYAQPPAVYGLHKIGVCTSNKTLLQSLDSTVCGHYCIYYLYNRSLGHSLHAIVSIFSPTSLACNDSRVRMFVRNLSKPGTQCVQCKCNCTSACPCKQICVARCNCTIKAYKSKLTMC